MKLHKPLPVTMVTVVLGLPLLAQAEGDWKRGRVYYRMVCTACHVEKAGGSIAPSKMTKAEWAAYMTADKHAKNIIYNRGASTVMILDNDITGMTGQQENPGTGVTLQGQATKKIDLEAVVRGMGVEDVFVVEALDEHAVEKTIKQALSIKDRPSVIISRGPCVFLPDYPPKFSYDVNEKCNGCSMCFRVGCPAIFKGELDLTTKQPKALIDPLLCVGCDICAQVCPHDAIDKVNN